MRRLWFKKEMKKAILEGRKRATTRLKPLHVGERFQAVSGSRYDAKPFAIIEITSRRKIDSLVEHCTKHYEAEGFQSSLDMAGYIRDNLPQYRKIRPLYYHTFTWDYARRFLT